jgi:hypothetical protein
MQNQIETLLQTRKFLLKLTENLTNKQLNKIPAGFKNNIAWNIAHLLVTQQLLCYKLSGLPCLVSEEMIENFQKGSMPNYEVSEIEMQKIKKQFIELPILLKEDYSNGIFKNYNPYTTSVNVTLNTVDEAIAFNLYHEGIHLGIILQLLKFI